MRIGGEIGLVFDEEIDILGKTRSISQKKLKTSDKFFLRKEEVFLRSFPP